MSVKFLCPINNEGDDILRSFTTLSAEDKTKYTPVKAQFDAHFVKRRNIIYERAKLNQHKQEEGDPVDTFITVLYSLAEHCGYRSLHDEMIRNCIVVGIHHSQLSMKLQLVADLTLERPSQASGKRKRSNSNSRC